MRFILYCLLLRPHAYFHLRAMSVIETTMVLKVLFGLAKLIFLHSSKLDSKGFPKLALQANDPGFDGPITTLSSLKSYEPPLIIQRPLGHSLTAIAGSFARLLARIMVEA